MRLMSSFQMLIFGVISFGCSSSPRSANITCASTKSIIKSQTLTNPAVIEGTAGLLITTQLDHPKEKLLEPLATDEIVLQCNTSLELLQETPPKLRLWTAAHCFKPLLMTSMSLAIRDKSSASALYFKWELDHQILQAGRKMRSAFQSLNFDDQTEARSRLYNSFDRRNMYVEGASAILNPRVSCENLRWSLDADRRHSLCFSIFDLIYLDVDLPEPESNKSKALVASLMKTDKNAQTADKIVLSRETFLRRMNTTSQVSWIIHDSERIRDNLGTLPETIGSKFLGDVSAVDELNSDVFSLPHQEESSFMEFEDVLSQDAIPPAVNQSHQVRAVGHYVSPRVNIPGVEVGCYRQLKKFNTELGATETLPDLEKRPHEFCAGGANFQADHFWLRNREWSWMMADLTLDAAHRYSKSIFDLVSETLDVEKRINRLEVVSSFGLSNNLGFDDVLVDLSTPLLRHLRIPVSSITQSIFGIEKLEETGAFLFSKLLGDTEARFLKGDSGSIVLLDGIPIATLYSVDGEETSGGASIMSLPELSSIDEDNDASGGSQSRFARGRVDSGASPSENGVTSSKIGCK